MIIGIPKETLPGETRVALIPVDVKKWVGKGVEILIEADAGRTAGHLDNSYTEAGAQVSSDRKEIFQRSDVILQIQSFGANRVNGHEDLPLLRPGQVVVGMMDPYGASEIARTMADHQVTALAMEMVPRISRAQSMDVLSAMATLAGYKAILLGAAASPRIIPLMMTAAGTLKPARIFIMGAGVAGLQACATAKRLGGVVEAYDVRPAARDQIVSVGAKPIELDLEAETTEDSGGYAKKQDESFLDRQRALMTEVLAQQDIVITTAAVPGAKSPILITEDMVRKMKPGAVIVDIAAERGGNCALTRLGETVVENDVIILGPENVPATIANHASQMYSKNMDSLFDHIIDADANLKLDFEDEIISGTTIAHNGEVTHPKMRELLGMPALTTEESKTETGGNA